MMKSEQHQSISHAILGLAHGCQSGCPCERCSACMLAAVHSGPCTVSLHFVRQAATGVVVPALRPFAPANLTSAMLSARYACTCCLTVACLDTQVTSASRWRARPLQSHPLQAQDMSTCCSHQQRSLQLPHHPPYASQHQCQLPSNHGRQCYPDPHRVTASVTPGPARHHARAAHHCSRGQPAVQQPHRGPVQLDWHGLCGAEPGAAAAGSRAAGTWCTACTSTTGTTSPSAGGDEWQVSKQSSSDSNDTGMGQPA